MGIGLLQDFVAGAKLATSQAALFDLLQDVVTGLGFRYFALVHHVPAARLNLQIVRLSNYPASWKERHAGAAYLLDDPIVAACQRTAVGFQWSDLPSLVDLSPRQAGILSEAEAHGLGDGFSAPINIPGEWPGSSSFVMHRGEGIAANQLPIAQYAACFGFEAARRVLERAAPAPEGQVQLTTRQLDCLVQIARGKTDWEAAALLGISRDTVHQHIEAAKGRFGVATRTQLVVSALYQSALTFPDILG